MKRLLLLVTAILLALPAFAGDGRIVGVRKAEDFDWDFLGTRSQEGMRVEGDDASGIDIQRPILGDDLVIEAGAEGSVSDCSGTGSVINSSGSVKVST